VRPKDAAIDTVKRGSIVCMIVSEKQGDLYKKELIKKNDRDTRLSYIEASEVSQHAHAASYYPFWNEVKFIGSDFH